MNPQNIQFGLKHGLLEEDYGELVASMRFVEALSKAARYQFNHGDPLNLQESWEEILYEGLSEIIDVDAAPERRLFSFVGEIGEPVNEALAHLTELAGLVHINQNHEFEFNQEFATRLFESTAGLRPAKNEVLSAIFATLREILKIHLAENDSPYARHADLFAVYLFKFWHALGRLELFANLLDPDEMDKFSE